jgi:hypothetical protein
MASDQNSLRVGQKLPLPGDPRIGDKEHAEKNDEDDRGRAKYPDSGQRDERHRSQVPPHACRGHGHDKAAKESDNRPQTDDGRRNVEELVCENAVELIVAKFKQPIRDDKRASLADALDGESVRRHTGCQVDRRQILQAETGCDDFEPPEEARLLRGGDRAGAEQRERKVSAAEHRRGKEDQK